MRANRNILMIEEVARALGDLLEQCVFVGGATTALYIDDRGAPDPTPSDDVDLLVEVSSQQEYSALEKTLRKRGFKDPVGIEDAPVCRKYLGPIAVDFMASRESVLGFTNQWYEPALMHLKSVPLPSGLKIKIFSLPYFVASKLAAFKDRGAAHDLRMSQDLEDICSVLDGSSDCVDQIARAEDSVRTWIQSEVRVLLSDAPILEEAASGFIGYSREGDRRVQALMAKFKSLAGTGHRS